MKKVSIVLFIFVTTIALAGCVNKEWTLMICEWPHDSGGCGDIKYTLRGYESQKECMEKGIEIKNPQGFECGSDCKLSADSSLQVCEEICNEKGCSK